MKHVRKIKYPKTVYNYFLYKGEKCIDSTQIDEIDEDLAIEIFKGSNDLSGTDIEYEETTEWVEEELNFVGVYGFPVLIVPSSDDEGDYEKCSTFDEAYGVMEITKKGEDTAYIRCFHSEKDRELYLQGFSEGQGWMGENTYFKAEETSEI